MKKFLILLQKELKEAWCSGKWIWFPIALVILGISQPLSTYYMPQILEKAGNLPEGAVIEIPVPTGGEMLASTLGQFGTVGTLLIVIAFMGAIANERQNRSLTLVMARPVSALQYIASKWCAQMLITFLSFFLSYIWTWYYTNLLFTSVSWNRALASFLLYCLWLLFTLSVTIFFGTVFKTTSGIAGVSLVLLGGLSILSGLFTRFFHWSPSHIRAQAAAMLIQGELAEHGLLVIITTTTLSMLLIGLAALNFHRFDRF